MSCEIEFRYCDKDYELEAAGKTIQCRVGPDDDWESLEIVTLSESDQHEFARWVAETLARYVKPCMVCGAVECLTRSNLCDTCAKYVVRRKKEVKGS